MAKRTNASNRIIMRIELSPEAKEQFIDFGDSLGMTQVAVASRLVEWLTKQSDVIQAGVLGLYPEDIRAEVPSMLLKHLIAEKKA
jgi:hypothetical protein